MNKKGYTLIELLVVIVIIGLLAIIVVPISIDVFKNSKIKNEEIFVGKLSDITYDYITLNSDEISFSNSEIIDAVKSKENQEYHVDVKKTTITFQNIINSRLIAESDFKNPGNQEVACNKNAEIEIYRDSDYVYCHKIKKTSLMCLTEDYLNTVEDDIYIIDTCNWRNTND